MGFRIFRFAAPVYEGRTMSIRLIARELYRCRREVDRLTRALETAGPSQIPALSDALRKAVAEKNAMQRVLDGQKGASTYPTKRLPG